MKILAIILTIIVLLGACCVSHSLAEQLNEADPNFKHHRTGDHMRYGTGYWTGRRRYNRTGNWTGKRHSRTSTTSASPTSTSRS